MNKRLLTALLLLCAISSAQAVIIESTTANQVSYKNGDLIILDIDTNAPGLEINADFNSVDSNYDPRMVLVEAEGEQYRIIYPISHSNTRGDNEYNSIITAFDPTTSTTSSITYTIRLQNTGQRQEDSVDLEIEVTNGSSSTIDIVEGYIRVCDKDGCETITEEEYEASRRVIVEGGTVELGDLTYNQLKEEIAADVNQELRAELRAYVEEITQIKRLLDQSLYDLEQLVAEQQNSTNQTFARSEQLLRRGMWNNILFVALVTFLIGGFAYTLYLRTETTWFTR